MNTPTREQQAVRMYWKLTEAGADPTVVEARLAQNLGITPRDFRDLILGDMERLIIGLFGVRRQS